MQGLQGNVETYLALRTRLPVDQGIQTYYPNIHRDWAWGDEENKASLKQIQSVLHDHADLGKVLVLGSGAGRLAYDIHTSFNCDMTVAVDFNPLLMLVAKAVTSGEQLNLYEFPIAPLSLEDDAVLRQLGAPESADDNFHLVFADALRAPFAAGSFDTVVTPWLIDVITEELPVLAARINQLLNDNGRWVNFRIAQLLLAKSVPAVTARKKPKRLSPRTVFLTRMSHKRRFPICAHPRVATVDRNECFRSRLTRNARYRRLNDTRHCPTGL